MKTLRERQIQKILHDDIVPEVTRTGSAVWTGNKTGREALDNSDIALLRAAMAEQGSLMHVEQVFQYNGIDRVGWVVFARTISNAWERHCRALLNFAVSLLKNQDIDAKDTVRTIIADAEILRLRLQTEHDVKLTHFVLE